MTFSKSTNHLQKHFVLPKGKTDAEYTHTTETPPLPTVMSAAMTADVISS